jgi:hypothetical protein
VVILGHFRNYLDKNGACVHPALAPHPPLPDPNTSPTPAPLVYVKKWLKTPHAIIFRLSNKTIQV